jgi:hypothetical protein
LVQRFLSEVHRHFAFLESDYGYSRVESGLREAQYYRDANARVRYAGAAVGVEVYWYFAEAAIDVAFYELVNGTFAEHYSFIGEPWARSIATKLRTLAGFLNKDDSDLFLLRGIDDPYPAGRSRKRRQQVIDENLDGVVAGLAAATKGVAVDIITGDTSMFADVLLYYTKLQRNR